MFHIIMGSILLNPRFMYRTVIFAVTTLFLVSLLQLYEIIPYYNLFHLPQGASLQTISFETLILFSFLMLCVYLISKLTDEIKISHKRLYRSNHKLLKTLETLDQNEKKKTKFMLFSAHQLRSPLATVISVLTVLKNKMIPLESERAYTILVGCYTEANKLLELVKGLLKLAELRENTAHSKIEENINVVELIENSLFSLNPLIKENKIKITRKYRQQDKSFEFEEIASSKESLDTQVQSIHPVSIQEGVRKDLDFAFYNLIQNAIKYSQKNSDQT